MDQCVCEDLMANKGECPGSWPVLTAGGNCMCWAYQMTRPSATGQDGGFC